MRETPCYLHVTQCFRGEFAKKLGIHLGGPYVDKSYAEKLAEFIVSFNLKDVPTNVIEHTKLCILDWFGAALAGANEKEAAMLIEFFKDFTPREATMMGSRFKVPAQDAAYVNGTISHMIELDDVHREAIIHPGAPVVPAALALSEKLSTPGSTLIEAVIVGYEVEIAVGKAVNPSHYRYWHTTGTCGTFGAAAASSKVLNLTLDKTINCLGIAGTHAAGLIEVFGTSSKPLNPGRAARDGVMAALLARIGFTGPKTILEGEKGFFKATSTETSYEKGFSMLGITYEITRNSFKRHASCGHTHAAIDAVLDLKSQFNFKPKDVVEVVVGTYKDALEIVGKNYEPKTPAEAKFSLPYCIAIAIIDGVVGLRQFTYENLNRSDIRDLMKRVKVYLDNEMNMTYPQKLGAKVRVALRNGEVYEKVVESAKGSPENPLSKDELINKFMDLASLKVSLEKSKELVNVIMKLEKLNSVNELIEVLTS
ncbi:MAG: MmgE/PrpD family protein [Candidatus Nezhaarchaeales archaeon]